MKKFLTLPILTLCSVAAFSECVTLTNSGPGQRLVSNTCAYPIQIELRGADSSREMMFLNAFGNESTGTGGDGRLQEFDCPTPSVPSQLPNQPYPVEYSTVRYYCWKNQ